MLAESLPVPTKNLHRASFLAVAEATVLNAPLSQLLPAMYRHSCVTHHDLIEFEGKRVAVDCGTAAYGCVVSVKALQTPKQVYGRLTETTKDCPHSEYREAQPPATPDMDVGARSRIDGAARSKWGTVRGKYFAS